MKKTILINLHSFVDVITNSSTELFVCDTDKSVEVVKQILQDKLDSWNRNEGHNRSFDDVFCEPYIYTKEMYESRSEWAWDWENPDSIGKMIIESNGDNAIPYDMWDDINYIFNGCNYHLG